MPTERSLIKCGEIFFCEEQWLLEYQCSLCMIWFHSHEKCVNHIISECVGNIIPRQNTPGTLEPGVDIVGRTNDFCVELIEIIPTAEEFYSDADVDQVGNSSKYKALVDENDPTDPPELIEIIPTKDDFDTDAEDSVKHEQPEQDPMKQTLEEFKKPSSAEAIADAPPPTKRKRDSTNPHIRFKTPIENEKFSRLLLRRRHKSGDNIVHCDMCAATYKTRERLFVHMHREHINQDLTCKRCGEQFARLRDLQTHVRTNYPPDPLACEFCGKTFKLKINFDSHVRIHTGERPFVCKDCGQRFVQNSSLKVHMRVAHTGEKPFKCKKCPAAFVTRFLMVTHDKREHLKIPRERNHKCDRCDMAFYELDVLLDHIRTHTGEKPFVCEFCSRGFAKRYALNVHRNIHTGNVPCKCKYCDRAFHSSAARRSHEKGVHKMK